MAAKKPEDLGEAEVQKTFDVGDKQGYLGQRSDPFPLSAWSLESGPDSPSIAETFAKAAKEGA